MLKTDAPMAIRVEARNIVATLSRTSAKNFHLEQATRAKLGPSWDRAVMNFCQLSNLLGLFPIFLALQSRLYFLAAALSTSVLLSFIYHLDEHNELALKADMYGCSLLASFMFYLVLDSESVLTRMNIISIVYGTMAIYFFFGAGNPGTELYHDYHTGWHVCAVYSVATFVYSYIHSTKLENSPSRLSKRIDATLLAREGRRMRALVEPVLRPLSALSSRFINKL
ncbi:unnamed protein product [Durusdinium trenchii]|uniref:Uncharacterized protein n=1 Tax=Durusdinium trenchii TaxID=1381693 RepID=A0ABP0KFF9_9DINO